MGLNSGSLSGCGSGLELQGNLKKRDGRRAARKLPNVRHRNAAVVAPTRKTAAAAGERQQMPIEYQELTQGPHPEERASARVSKDEAETTEDADILMVRDGARAPPHHEDAGMLATNA